MKYSQAKQGRVFVIRLEDADIVHKSLEAFAAKKKIKSASLIVVGAADKKSKLVVGPKQARKKPVVPMQHVLGDVCEVSGVGTIFPDKNGKPIVHIHIACGRKAKTVTGCLRPGVLVWHVMEIVLIELVNCKARRLFDKKTGFALLNP